MEWMSELPFFSDFLGLWQVLGAEIRGAVKILCVLVLTAVVSYIVAKVIARLEVKLAGNTRSWDDILVHAIKKPAAAFIWLQGIFWAAEIAYRHSQAEIFTANEMLLRIGVIWLLAWTAIRFVREFEKAAVSPRAKHPMDLTTVSAVGKLARAVIVLTAVLIIMQSLGYSISGVLAFGGIGGIAVGFAAKDLLANFFGGAMIYMDRPFKVGDWIRSPDKQIEGSVEHIGWRLTRIRTFDLRPLYVPNAIFTTISVENPSRMLNRRIYQVIGIRYADIHVMGSITDQVRDYLQNHEEVDIEQGVIANFEKFGDSSLDFFIYCYLHTTSWVTYNTILQDVLLRISEIVMEHGAEIALPTQRLHIADSVDVRQRTDDAKDASREREDSFAAGERGLAGTQVGSQPPVKPPVKKGEPAQRDISEAERADERRRKAQDKGPLDDEDQGRPRES